MSQPSTHADFAAALSSSATFEDAASVVLQAALDLADAALAGTRQYGDGRILRAMLHIRPTGYRALAVVDREPLEGGAELLPSTSAWRLLHRERRAVELDIFDRAFSSAARVAEQRALTLSSFPQRSGERLLGRQTTHLYALPLFDELRIVGMLTVEACCTRAVGRKFVWHLCEPALGALVTACTGPLLEASTGLARAWVPSRDAELYPIAPGRAMTETLSTLRKFARSPDVILLTGETGTGKSRLARWVHAHSGRADRPFRHVRLPANAQEQAANLFGTRKGAFTGAEDRDGEIALARDGTVFVDEVDKLTTEAQQHLLQVLDDGWFQPLGSEQSYPTSGRFVFATNADLEREVREGRFLEDLLYRIDVLGVSVPPLRERADEVGAWALHEACLRHDMLGTGGELVLADDAIIALSGHAWPGNIRQLRNVMAKAYLHAADDAWREGEPEVAVRAVHVEHAVDQRQAPRRPTSDLLQRLDDVARAWVLHAERGGDEGLQVDLVEALKVMIWEAAVRRADLPGGDTADRRRDLAGSLGLGPAYDNRKLGSERGRLGAARRARQALQARLTDGDGEEGP